MSFPVKKKNKTRAQKIIIPPTKASAEGVINLSLQGVRLQSVTQLKFIKQQQSLCWHCHLILTVWLKERRKGEGAGNTSILYSFGFRDPTIATRSVARSVFLLGTFWHPSLRPLLICKKCGGLHPKYHFWELLIRIEAKIKEEKDKRKFEQGEWNKTCTRKVLLETTENILVVLSSQRFFAPSPFQLLTT